MYLYVYTHYNVKFFQKSTVHKIEKQKREEEDINCHVTVT